MNKICSQCRIEQDISNFSFVKPKSPNDLRRKAFCKACESKKSKEKYLRTRDAHNQTCKDYKRNNKNKVRILQSRWEKDQHKNNPFFKLRKSVSVMIRMGLKLEIDPFKFTVWRKLPYTPQDLRNHLESQFETWMNWGNYGVFSKERKTWQMDHIVRQSELLYDSLDHPNFLKCWDLTNLRPLEAIKNISARRLDV